MEETMARNLKEKTGKSLDQWVEIAGKSGCEKHGEIIKYLKTDHGLTHGYANLIAHTLRNAGAGETDLVAAQYDGAKADLKPIYDAIVKAAKKLGKDVEVAPKKSYVSLRRNKQFALIQPSTKTRVDLGLQLKGVSPDGRLEKSGSFNAMVSHRVRLEKKGDVDKQVLDWLGRAYDAG